METHGTAPLSPRRAQSAGATPSKETPEQRHARRVAWGKSSGAKVAAAYKALTEAK